MNKEVGKIKVADIIVGERMREDKDLGDIDELAASIKQNGLIHPIVVNTRKDGKYDLIAGGRRMAAITQLGWTETIVRFYENLNANERELIELEENIKRKDLPYYVVLEKKKKYHEIMMKVSGAADGTKPGAHTQAKTAEALGESPGGLSDELFAAAILEKMPQLKQVVQSRTDAVKLVRALKAKAKKNKIAEGVAAAVEQGKLPAAKIKLANSYMIGDAFELMKQVKNGTVDLVWCDSPFGIDLNQIRKEQALTKAVKSGDYEEWTGKEYFERLPVMIDEAKRVLKESGWLVFWFATRYFHEVKTALLSAGFDCGDIPAIWVKNTGQSQAPTRWMGRSWQPFFYAPKGNGKLVRGRLDIFMYDVVNAAHKEHRTECPIELFADAISMFVKPGDFIVDMFTGSGNLLLAAANYGCKAIGFDSKQVNKDAFLVKVERDEIGSYSSYKYRTDLGGKFEPVSLTEGEDEE